MLYNQGLIKQEEGGSWVAVDSFQEQQVILQQRDQEVYRVQQLEH